jgi:hypothetical protein
MSDEKFTSAAIKLLTATRDMCEWGEEKGLLDIEKVRLTVSARKEKAKELVDAGMSQRQAAKVLGVSHTAIQKDLATKLPNDGNKVATPEQDDDRPTIDKPPRGELWDDQNDKTSDEEVELLPNRKEADADHEEGLRVIAARGFLNRAVEAKKICTIGKLRAPDVTEAMIKAADDAAAAWSKAAHNLRGMITHV